MFIEKIVPGIIKDSRKERTIEIKIKTLKGSFSASAPYGKSIGRHEVLAYNNRGIDRSLKMLKVFANKLRNANFRIKTFNDLREFEKEIRKFEQKFGKFGANCVYALETCFLKAAAKENKKELWQFVGDKPKIPAPIGNCIGGGLHSQGRKKPDFQEFLLISKEKRFSKAVTKIIHAYERAKRLIKKSEKKWRVKKNDENAWMTGLTNEDALELLFQLGKSTGLKIGIDVAGSSFYKNGYYNYENKRLIRDRKEQIEYIERLKQKYRLFYIEDPVQEEDFSGFVELSDAIKKQMRKSKKEILIVGDDLTATNLTRLRRAVQSKAINAVIIKPNQTGSLLFVAGVVDFCKKNKIKMIFSHRSGETMDDALSDYAVGFGADFIKCGINGRERLIKLRRVMEIERDLRG